eukprot:SAG31_NODE_6085_length_2178_cov_2.675325_2_plen_77_part_00
MSIAFCCFWVSVALATVALVATERAICDGIEVHITQDAVTCSTLNEFVSDSPRTFMFCLVFLVFSPQKGLFSRVSV